MKNDKAHDAEHTKRLPSDDDLRQIVDERFEPEYRHAVLETLREFRRLEARPIHEQEEDWAQTFAGSGIPRSEWLRLVNIPMRDLPPEVRELLQRRWPLPRVQG